MIDRIEAGDFSTFYGSYYRPERPVILLHAAQKHNADANTLWRYLRTHILEDAASRTRPLWFEANQDAVAAVTDIPAVVAQLFQRQDISVRRNFVRAWYSQAGHVTPWHYDGNDLHVCNLQLKGSKRWRILSPNTPLPCVPFSNICLPPDRPVRGGDYYDFLLQEGELLFLPRYWFHRVESLSEANINVNWVFTSPPRDGLTRTSRREAELRWLKGWLPGSNRETLSTTAASSSNSGRSPLSGVNHPVTYANGARRFLQEMARIPALLLATPWLVPRLLIVYNWRRTHGSGRATEKEVRQTPFHQ